MTIRPPPSNALVLAMLAFGNFIIGMGAFVVVGIVSPIAEGLGVSTASAGLVLTSYAFAYAVASPIAVALTGRAARRSVLCAALALFALGSLASALSTSLSALVAARVLVATGACLFTPVAAGVAVALSDPAKRGKALATVFGGLTLAQVVGVPAGAWLAYRFGWEATFWLVSGLAVAALAVLAFAIPRDVAFQSASLAAMVDTLRDARVSFAIAFTATLMVAVYIVFTYFGPIIEASMGTNPEYRSFYLVLFGIGAVIGNYAGGWLSDRIGSVATLAVLCIGQALLMPLFSLSPWAALPFAVLVMTWSSFGWSFMAPQQARLVSLAPQAQALVLALNAAMIYVGVAIGSAVASRILAGYGLAALGLAGAVGAAAALLHLLVSVRLSRPRGAPGHG